jgi:DNA-binding CsgD family transcriptional regulator
MANTKKTAPKLPAAQQAALDGMTQTASRVRYLLSEGHSRGDVARILGIRYQWVRNVAITPLKNG